MLLDVAEGEDLVEPGDDRQLLGLEALDARPAEHLDQVALDLGPGVLHAVLRVELLGPQALGHGADQRAQGYVEGVAQRVRRVGSRCA